jgi:hypothetical protein
MCQNPRGCELAKMMNTLHLRLVRIALAYADWRNMLCRWTKTMVQDLQRCPHGRAGYPAMALLALLRAVPPPPPRRTRLHPPLRHRTLSSPALAPCLYSVAAMALQISGSNSLSSLLRAKEEDDPPLSRSCCCCRRHQAARRQRRTSTGGAFFYLPLGRAGGCRVCTCDEGMRPTPPHHAGELQVTGRRAGAAQGGRG